LTGCYRCFFSILGKFTTASFRIVSLKRRLKEVISNKQKELIPHLNTLLLRDSRSSPCLSTEQFPYGPKSNFFLAFVGAFAELRKATIRFVISVRLHGTTRLPQKGFSLNVLVFFENLPRRFKFH